MSKTTRANSMSFVASRQARDPRPTASRCVSNGAPGITACAVDRRQPDLRHARSPSRASATPAPVLGQRLFEDGSGQVHGDRADRSARPRRRAASDGPRVRRQLDPKFHKRLHFAWRLAGGARSSQYAAMVDAARRSQAPRRSTNSRSVPALRGRCGSRSSCGCRTGRRWQRSVYLDETPREIIVPMRR